MEQKHTNTHKQICFISKCFYVYLLERKTDTLLENETEIGDKPRGTQLGFD